MSAFKILSLSASALLVAAQPTVNTVNAFAITYTTPAANPNGVAIAPQASIVITDANATAQITTLYVCLDHASSYWRYSDALVCPAPESLAPANLACTW